MKRVSPGLMLAVWIALQLLSGVVMFLGSFYYTYTLWNWLLLAAWSASLLALDFLLKSGGEQRMLRCLQVYWAVSAAGFALLLLAYPARQGDAYYAGILAATLPLPVWQIFALSWLVLRKGTGLDWDVVDCAAFGLGLLLSLGHLIYFLRLYRRRGAPAAGEEGGRRDGSA